ncbi:MAG: hypothetical protein QM539_02520, partial [Alphaproteobacteria bacterium]|nr:hypothetical protein [Alphaproteobacteria bacterium]
MNQNFKNKCTSLKNILMFCVLMCCIAQLNAQQATIFSTNKPSYKTGETLLMRGLNIKTIGFRSYATKDSFTITSFLSKTYNPATNDTTYSFLLPNTITNNVYKISAFNYSMQKSASQPLVRFLNSNIDGFGIAAWGSNDFSETTIPSGLNKIMCAESGDYHNLALKSDGTVVAWGYDNNGQSTIPNGLNNVVSIAAGSNFSLALKSDGTVVAWGNNAYKQTVIPNGLNNVVSITAGSFHSVALKSDGTVVAWGRNDYGQTTIPNGLNNVVSIDAKEKYCLALKSDGTVVAWGRNDYGQTTIPNGLNNVISIAAGDRHCLALKPDGTVAAWGSNTFGQTSPPGNFNNIVSITAGGFNSLALKSDGTVVAWGWNNKKQNSIPSGLNNVVSVMAGGYFSLALYKLQINTSSNAGGSISPSSFVKYGDNIRVTYNANPGYIIESIFINDVLINDSLLGFTFKNIQESQKIRIVFTLGNNIFTSVMNGSITPQQKVKQNQNLRVTYLPNIGYELDSIFINNTYRGKDSINGYTFYNVQADSTIKIAFKPATIAYHTTEDNSNYSNKPSYRYRDTLIVTGRNINKLRFKSYISYIASPRIDSFDYINFLRKTYNPQTRDTNYFVMIPKVLNTGVYLIYGINYQNNRALTQRLIRIIPDNLDSFGIMGWGRNNEGQSMPPLSLQLDNVVSISAGDYHSLALKADGTVLGWGSNSHGQITMPNGLTDVVMISAGRDNSFALKSDGAVVAWGSNSNGQTTIPNNLADVVSIAAGFNAPLALKSNGNIVAWGNNFYDQLNIPSAVNIGNDVIAIAAGGRISAALKSNGTAYKWGWSQYGTQNIPPIQSHVRAIAAGINFLAYLNPDSTVSGYGTNHVNGKIPGFTKVVGVSAGNYYHFIALKADSTVKTWGVITQGQYEGPQNFGQAETPSGIKGVIAAAAGGFHNLVQYKLEIVTSADANGTISPSRFIKYGENIPVTFKGNSGYVVDSFLINGLSSDNYLVQHNGEAVYRPSNKQSETVRVTFTHGYYVFTTAINGTISPTRGVPFDSNTRITYQAPSGYRLDSVVVDGVKTNDSTSGYTFRNVREDHDIKVYYTPFFAITTMVVNGNISPSETSIPLSASRRITFNPLSDDYAIDSILVNGVLVNDSVNGYTCSNISKNYIIRIVYRLKTFEITTQATNGTISPIQLVTINETTRITYQALNNAFLDSVVVDGVLTNDSISGYTFRNVREDHNIKLYYTPSFAITTSAVNGNISPSTYVKSGNNFRITYRADSGYIIESVFLNNVLINDSLQGITFININQIHNIRIVCTPVYKILTNAVNGTITQQQTITRSQNAHIIYAPNIGYELDSIFINNRYRGKDSINGYTFYNLRGDSTINIKFSRTKEAYITNLNKILYKQNDTVTILGANIKGLQIKSGIDSFKFFDFINKIGVNNLDTNYYWVIPAQFKNRLYSLQVINFNNNLGLNVRLFNVANNLDSLGIASWGRNSSGETINPSGLNNVVSLAAGGANSLALKSDGTVVAWGSNNEGQSSIPNNLNNVVKIAAGGGHNLALKSDGTVVAWGQNNYGQVNVPSGLNNVVSIATGLLHSLALKSDGTVVTWGYNEYGILNIPSGLKKVVSVAAGGLHSLALKSDGTLVAWGWDYYGQCNIPSDLNNIVSMSGGEFNSLALKSNGTVVAWGRKNDGQLNIPSDLNDVVSIAAGSIHGLALKSNGTLVAWGNNYFGNKTIPSGLNNVVSISSLSHNLALYKLQVNTSSNYGGSVSPSIFVKNGDNIRVTYNANPNNIIDSIFINGVLNTDSLQGYTFRNINESQNVRLVFSYRITEDYINYSNKPSYRYRDTLIVTGRNINKLRFKSYISYIASPRIDSFDYINFLRKTYNPQTRDTNYFVMIPKVLNTGVYLIYGINYQNNRALTQRLIRIIPDNLDSFGIMGWGRNNEGQSMPPLSLQLDNVVSISAGDYHSLALKADGTVLGWGSNSHGQITMPNGLTDVVMISAGRDNSFALKSDGAVVAWGSNSNGQTTIPNNLADVVSIAAGFNAPLALKSNGNIVAWGNNFYDQLNIPSAVNIGNDVIAIAAGGRISAALKSNGTAYKWGWSQYGTQNIPPIQSHVRAIAAGINFLAYLNPDSTVSGYGTNHVNGKIPGFTKVVGVSAGNYYHFIALKADSTVKTWGVITQGQYEGPQNFGQAETPSGIKGVIAAAAGGFHNLVQYKLEIVTSADANGTISPSRFIKYGENIPVTFKGNSGYVVDSFLINGLSSDNYLVQHNGEAVYRPSNKQSETVRVTFTHGYYVFTTAINGTISPTRGVPFDSNTRITYQAPSGYRLDSVVVDGVKTNDSTSGYTFRNVREDHDIKVYYTPFFAITTMVVNGNISPSETSIPLSASRRITFNPLSDDYAIDSILVNGVLVNDSVNGYTCSNISKNYIIRIVYRLKTFEITTQATNGTISPIQLVTINETTRITYQALNNAFLDSVVVDGVLTNDSISGYTFRNVREDHNIKLYYTPSFAITTSAVNGNISPSTYVKSGNNFRITYRADSGYIIESVFLNNVLINDSLQGITFININQIHNIRIVCTPVYKILTNAVNGTITQQQTITRSQNAHIIYAPNIGYELDSIFINNRYRGKDSINGYTFYNLRGDSTINIKFSRTKEAYITNLNKILYKQNDTVTILGANIKGLQIKSGIDSFKFFDFINKIGVNNLDTNYYWVIPAQFKNRLYSLQVINFNNNLGLNVRLFNVANNLDSLGIASWGRNSSGETINPSGLNNVVSLAAGGANSLALKSDGTVVAWGSNNEGQSSIPNNLNNVVKIAAGGGHNLALKSDGTVVAWGQNNYGQVNVPSGLNNVVSIATGLLHSLALKSDGTVVTWGYNEYGILNIPSGLKKVVSVAAGGLHSLALKSDGTLVAWGWDYYGQCNIPSDLNNIVSMSGGEFNSLALKSNGTVVAWGRKNDGQLNIPSDLNDVVSIAAGSIHGLALKSNGTLVAWGNNYFGNKTIPSGLNNVVSISSLSHNLALYKLQVNTSSNYGGSVSPSIFVKNGDNIRVTYNANPNNIIDSIFINGVLNTDSLQGYTFRNINESQNVRLVFSNNFNVITNAINGTITSSQNFKTVRNVRVTYSPNIGYELDSIFINNRYCGIDSINGYTFYNVQGDSSINISNTPNVDAYINNLNKILYKQNDTLIITGRNIHSIQIKSGVDSFRFLNIFNKIGINSTDTNYYWIIPDNFKNRLYSLQGINFKNKLGLHVHLFNVANNIDSLGIVAWGNNDNGQTTIPSGLKNVLLIAAGARHGLALKSDGTVAAWGRNNESQTTIPSNINNVVLIAAGESHNLALKSNGTVMAWGNNNYGQTTIPSGLNNVVSIAAGLFYSLALKSDGTVVAWGYNINNILNMPSGINNIVSLTAGSYHSLALKSNGTVVAWGRNFERQSTIPNGLNNVESLAAGAYYSLALKSNGTVVAWGNNLYGQTTIPNGLTNVVSLAAGYNHSLALKSDGTVVAWGENDYGQRTIPSGLKNVVSLAARGNYSLALLKLQITTSSNNGGRISPSIFVKNGDNLRISYNANPGYVIDSVFINGVHVAKYNDSSSLLLENIFRNQSIRVVFKIEPPVEVAPITEPTFDITTSANGGGTISPSGNALRGHNAIVTYQPFNGYLIDSVFINGVHVANYNDSSSIHLENILSNQSIRVVFKIEPPVEVAPITEPTF